MSIKVHAEQGELVVPDPLAPRREVAHPDAMADTPSPVLSPKVLDYDPVTTDPNPGFSIPLVEGWSVLHRVLKDIARERSNVGFGKLPEDSRPVAKFAGRVETTRAEAKELVEDTSGKKYERAQFRLNDLWRKQVSRSLAYLSVYRIVDKTAVTDSVPMDVGTVEHRFFYANSDEEAKANDKKRRAIAAYVKKHSV